MAKGLEGHVVLELDSWRQGRVYDEKKWDFDKYQSTYVEFSSTVQISAGKLEGIMIHKGNQTEVYFEDVRFKPVKLFIVAVPFLRKNEYAKGDCNFVDYFTHDVYKHPNGTLYSATPLVAYDSKNKELPVKLPFEYNLKSLLSIPKANALLKRNAEVLKEVTSRIDELESMRDLILRSGKSK